MIDAILLGTVAVLMLLGVFVLREDKLDPLALFSALYFPRFVLRPGFLLFGLDTPRHPFLFYQDIRDLARETVIICILGYVGFLVGYMLSKGRLSRAMASRLPGYDAVGFSAGRLRALTAAGVAASLVIVALFVSRSGSTAAFMYESRHGLWAGISFLQRVPLVTSFVAGLYLFQSLESDRRRVPLALGMFVGTLLLLFAMGDRGAVLNGLLVVMMVWHFSRRTISYRAFFLAAVSLVTLLILMGMLRDATFASRDGDFWTSFESQRASGASAFARQVTEYMNLTSVDHMMVVIQDFDLDTYHFGSDFYRGVIGVVPRSLWPDKPEAINIGIWFRDTYMPGKSGKPITAVGGYYLNFGLVGVFVGCLVSGFFARMLFTYLQGTSFRYWAAALYVSVFFNMTSWGLITTTFPMTLVLWGVPLYFIYWFGLLRVRRRDVRRGAPRSTWGARTSR